MGKIIKNGIEYAGCNTDIYTKSQTDALLNNKADKSTTYTKTETNDLVNNKVAFPIANFKSVKFDKSTTRDLHQIIAIHSDDTQWAVNFEAGNIKVYERADGNVAWTTREIYTADNDTGWTALNTIISYRAKNGTCTVALRGAVPEDIPSGGYKVLGTLPIGCRPGVIIYGTVYVNNFPSVIRIQSNGSVDLYGASGITANQVISGMLTYVV